MRVPALGFLWVVGPGTRAAPRQVHAVEVVGKNAKFTPVPALPAPAAWGCVVVDGAGSAPVLSPHDGIGLEKSAIGTLVERTSRYTMLLHLPRMEGFGAAPYVKNGPPLAGHRAKAVRDAITAQIGMLPEQLRRSLT